jgi:hypothetical protein|tara:strand:+ start:44 stop:220 length:177 start_codon:yes stop_codon:yes gene_type:complete
MIDKSSHEIEALGNAKERAIEIVKEIGFEKPLAEYTKYQFETLIEAAVDGYHSTGPCL